MAIVLVVDDDWDVVQTIKNNLINAGYQVACAYSADEALQLLEHRAPDLVLLDIALPGMDGITLCQQLRANPATARIAILIVTVSGDIESKTDAFNAGADDYLVKPFDLQELELRIKALLLREKPGLLALSS